MDQSEIFRKKKEKLGSGDRSNDKKSNRIKTEKWKKNEQENNEIKAGITEINEDRKEREQKTPV